MRRKRQESAGIEEGLEVKIARFEHNGTVSYGLVDGDSVAPVEGGLFGPHRPAGRPLPLSSVRLLAPVVPRLMLAVALNYPSHLGERPASPRPEIFVKGNNTLANPEQPIVLPAGAERVDYEGELVVVIGRRCTKAPPGEALSYVFGYTCGNDVSARDWQKEFGGTQWCRGKTFDTFCPLGPCLVTADEIPNPNSLAIKTVLNGQVMQDWNTNDMIFDVPALIEFLSGSTTLLPGTVIMTGTPHGVGMARKPPVWLTAGDRVVVEIEKIGALENPVVNELV
jgi:2-keto-4-pentenoate hydratase/2-oxohepta-3-ene-1,7-dioic acid hydratase in catechol pathway